MMHFPVNIFEYTSFFARFGDCQGVLNLMPRGSFNVEYVTPAFVNLERPYVERLPLKYPLREQLECSLLICAII